MGYTWGIHAKKAGYYPRKAVTEYIELFYNRQRIQTELGFLSPATYAEKQRQFLACVACLMVSGIDDIPQYLTFAMSPEALWPGNFRDLSASIERMQTYALSGIIDETLVEREITRLRRLWHEKDAAPVQVVETSCRRLPCAERHAVPLEQLLSTEALAGLDLFDRFLNFEKYGFSI